MGENSDLGQCEVHLLLSKSFPGTNAAPAAERDDQERTGAGQFPILQPAFRQELFSGGEVSLLLTGEPRVA